MSIVKNGVDVLVGGFAASRLLGFRVGLVANSASVTADGRPTWDALREAGVDLVCLFAPEHGVRLEFSAGEWFNGYRDDGTGFDVRSLHTERRRLAAECFDGVDLVVFDLPHIGCRFYTYIDTLAGILRFSHSDGLPVTVLDRPNPIRADVVEGPVPSGRIETPFAPFRIPVRYGMTVAELARFFSSQEGLSPQLNVVPMQGYRRDMWFDETGLPWMAASPNMRDFEAALLYPGTCLFEGTALSEGRGTDRPFRLFGSPWLDTDALLGELAAVETPGVAFERFDFTPSESKFAGQACRGVACLVTDRDVLRPVSLFLRVISIVRSIHRDIDFWVRHEGNPHYFLDMLLGSPDARLCIENAEPLEPLLYSFIEQAEEFTRLRSGFLVYDHEQREPRVW